MFKGIVQKRSTYVSRQSRAVWEVKLCLIPSRRIALKRGQDPHRVLLAMYQLWWRAQRLDYFCTSHFVSAFSLWMCCLAFPPSCISMLWGCIFCSTELLRGISLVGHGYIMHFRHHETHFWRLALNLIHTCWNKHQGKFRDWWFSLSWIYKVFSQLLSGSWIAQWLSMTHIK